MIRGNLWDFYLGDWGWMYH